MTTFNSLPLTEQLKALEQGDELHLRGGGWLPLVSVYESAILSHGFFGWHLDGSRNSKYTGDPMDIIRVVRPGEKREVPEIVELLRLEIQDLSEDMTATATNYRLAGVVTMFLTHFEAEARKQEKQP